MYNHKELAKNIYAFYEGKANKEQFSHVLMHMGIFGDDFDKCMVEISKLITKDNNMCVRERAIIKELREYLDLTDELKAKLNIVEKELKITFVKDNVTNKWTIASTKYTE